jgi:hypothetical protein
MERLNSVVKKLKKVKDKLLEKAPALLVQEDLLDINKFELKITSIKREIGELQKKLNESNSQKELLERKIKKDEESLSNYKAKQSEILHNLQTIYNNDAAKIQAEKEEVINKTQPTIGKYEEIINGKKGYKEQLKAKDEEIKSDKTHIASKIADLNLVTQWVENFRELTQVLEGVCQTDEVSALQEVQKKFLGTFKLIVRGIHKINENYWSTLLGIAINARAYACIEYLLKDPTVNVNQIDACNFSPIQLAARNVADPALLLLLDMKGRKITHSQHNKASEIYLNSASAQNKKVQDSQAYKKLLEAEEQASQEHKQASDPDSLINIRSSIGKMMLDLKDSSSSIAERHEDLAVEVLRNQSNLPNLKNKNTNCRYNDEIVTIDLDLFKIKCKLRAENLLNACNLIIKESGNENKNIKVKVKVKVKVKDKKNSNKVVEMEIADAVKKAVADFLSDIMEKSDYHWCYKQFRVLCVDLCNYLDSLKLDSAAADTLQHAENLINWSTQRSISITYEDNQDVQQVEGDDLKPIAYVQIDEPVFNLTQRQKDEWQSLTATTGWFKGLPEWERNMLEKKRRTTIQSGTHVPPCTVRCYPGIANGAIHTFSCCDASADSSSIVLTLSRFRSAIIVPRDVEEEDEKTRLAIQNILQLKNIYLGKITIPFINKYNLKVKLQDKNFKIPVLLQTLVSPRKLPETLSLGDQSKRISFNEKDLLRVKMTAALTLSDAQENTSYHGYTFEYIYTNYEVNKKKQLPKFNDNPPEVAAIISGVSDFFSLFKDDLDDASKDNYDKLMGILKQDSKNMKFQPQEVLHKQDPKLRVRFKLIQLLLDQYLYLKNIAHKKEISESQERNEENVALFTAAIEELIICLINGVAHCSCKSGKDRRAILLMYEDAILAYFHANNGMRIPKISDAGNERKVFQKLVAELFLTHHHSYAAEDNAKGCFGLKSVTEVLPGPIIDLLKASNKDLITFHRRCSYLNKIEKIISSGSHVVTTLQHSASTLSGKSSGSSRSSSASRNKSTGGSGSQLARFQFSTSHGASSSEGSGKSEQDSDSKLLDNGTTHQSVGVKR